MTDIFSNWFANIKFSKNPISQQFIQQPIIEVDDSIRYRKQSRSTASRISASLAYQSHGSEVVHPSTSHNTIKKNGEKLEDYLQTQQKQEGACGLTSVE
jgi:hypothetical protein